MIVNSDSLTYLCLKTETIVMYSKGCKGTLWTPNTENGGFRDKEKGGFRDSGGWTIQGRLVQLKLHTGLCFTTSPALAADCDHVNSGNIETMIFYQFPRTEIGTN